MLNPNHRGLYTAALTPPTGMVFDEGLAATYSLDPLVLLTVPVHLAFLGHGSDQVLDSLTALEAMRRLVGKITVYADLGRLQVPTRPHALYGLLEPMIVEVEAPRGGAFHPKFWVLRFVDPDGQARPLLRLVILSRNLTADRSWDLALTLEGTPTRKHRAQNSGLGRLIEALPDYAQHTPAPERLSQATRLAREVWCTPWELPPGFSDLTLHVNGRRRTTWEPHPSRRLAVISPFCSSEALKWLAKSTQNPVALISRSEELAKLPAEARGLFTQCYTLDEAAEADDGEPADEQLVQDSQGLHAKALIYESGSDTHLVVGSANATNPALLKPLNIELLAELVGKRSRVGGIDSLLGSEGLRTVLVDYPHDANAEVPLPEQLLAERHLEAARKEIARSALRLQFASADDGLWMPKLMGSAAMPQGILSVMCWLITTPREDAVDAKPLFAEGAVTLSPCAAASVTGLLALELRSTAADKALLFALNLPVDGLPPERDGAIFRLVLENREAFLRYLLLLLGDIEATTPQVAGTGVFGSWAKGQGTRGLMEELVRAYCRDPERLDAIRDVLARLQATDDGKAVIPSEFLKMWEVFRQAMESNRV